eukprot:g66874.t1
MAVFLDYANLAAAAVLMVTTVVVASVFFWRRHETPFAARTHTLIFLYLLFFFVISLLRMLAVNSDHFGHQLHGCRLVVMISYQLTWLSMLAIVLRGLRDVYAFSLSEWAAKALSTRTVSPRLALLAAIRNYTTPWFLAKICLLATVVTIPAIFIKAFTDGWDVWMEPQENCIRSTYSATGRVIASTLVMALVCVFLIEGILLWRFRRDDFCIKFEFYTMASVVFVTYPLPNLLSHDPFIRTEIATLMLSVVEIVCATATLLCPLYYSLCTTRVSKGKSLDEFAAYAGTPQGFHSMLSIMKRRFAVEYAFFLRDYSEWRLLWRPNWYRLPDAHLAQHMPFPGWHDLRPQRKEKILAEAIHIIDRYMAVHANSNPLLKIQFPSWLHQKLMITLHALGLLTSSAQNKPVIIDISQVPQRAASLSEEHAELLLEVFEDMYLDTMAVAYRFHQDIDVGATDTISPQPAPAVVEPAVEEEQSRLQIRIPKCNHGSEEEQSRLQIRIPKCNHGSEHRVVEIVRASTSVIPEEKPQHHAQVEKKHVVPRQAMIALSLVSERPSEKDEQERQDEEDEVCQQDGKEKDPPCSSIPCSNNDTPLIIYSANKNNFSNSKNNGKNDENDEDEDNEKDCYNYAPERQRQWTETAGTHQASSDSTPRLPFHSTPRLSFHPDQSSQSPPLEKGPPQLEASAEPTAPPNTPQRQVSSHGSSWSWNPAVPVVMARSKPSLTNMLHKTHQRGRSAQSDSHSPGASRWGQDLTRTAVAAARSNPSLRKMLKHKAAQRESNSDAHSPLTAGAKGGRSEPDGGRSPRSLAGDLSQMAGDLSQNLKRISASTPPAVAKTFKKLHRALSFGALPPLAGTPSSDETSFKPPYSLKADVLDEGDEGGSEEKDKGTVCSPATTSRLVADRKKKVLPKSYSVPNVPLPKSYSVPNLPPCRG